MRHDADQIWLAFPATMPMNRVFSAMRCSTSKETEKIGKMATENINKELLIEAVHKLPCLHDTSKKENKDEIVRENAWKSVCCEIFFKDSVAMQKNLVKVCAHFFKNNIF